MLEKNMLLLWSLHAIKQHGIIYLIIYESSIMYVNYLSKWFSWLNECQLIWYDAMRCLLLLVIRRGKLWSREHKVQKVYSFNDLCSTNDKYKMRQPTMNILKKMLCTRCFVFRFYARKFYHYAVRCAYMLQHRKSNVSQLKSLFLCITLFMQTKINGEYM